MKHLLLSKQKGPIQPLPSSSNKTPTSFHTNLAYKRHKYAHAKYSSLLAAGRVPSWADKEKIIQFYIDCPPELKVYHIVPIWGKRSCGYHTLSNLVYGSHHTIRDWHHLW